MLDTRIILAGLWAATMLTFLWGDVLGSISGYTQPGKLGESVYAPNHLIWVGIAALMMSPIVMIVLNLTLNPANKNPANDFDQGVPPLGGTPIATPTAPMVIWQVLSEISISERVSDIGIFSLPISHEGLRPCGISKAWQSSPAFVATS